MTTALTAVLWLLGAAPAGLAASVGITSPGPLTNITISDELNCSVNHVSDVVGEFYGGTACATELAFGGQIYGPSSIPAGNSPGGFTPVSQSAVTGSGTSGDPYKIVTVVDVGASTGLRITETDSYVVGLEAYRTDVQVTNTGATAASVIVYRGGDCYLQNSDLGFGSVGNPTGAVACVAAANPNDPSQGPGTRIEQWIPLTAGSHYFEDFYSTVWQGMSAQTDFPDTCECAIYQDNGAGLSWALTIPAGESRTVSHLTNFSPQGNLPLSTTKTADQSTALAGAQDGYTITLSNPNDNAVQLVSISDTLPAGFSYVAGSTTGATTANPTVVAQTLTWAGPFNVPAASGSGNGTLTLHFNVTVSATPGMYFNTATADGGSFVVVPTGNTAPVTVTGAPVNQAPVVGAGGPYTGTEGAATAVTGSATDADGDTLTALWTATLGAGTDPGSACTWANASSVTGASVTCNDDGSYTLTLTVNDGHNAAVAATATLTVANANPSVAITAPADASTFMVGATVSVAAAVGDPGANDTHTCSIDWGDGTSGPGVLASGVCSGSHAYAATGVYTVTVTATDDDGGSGSDSIMVVVADSETKVTGGGFVVNSGRTSFGFVAKSVAAGGFSGQLQIRPPGQHRFHGDTVTSLTVSQNTATWSGSGRWDGTSGYTYQVSVVDNGQGGGKNKTPDTISLVVRDGSGAVVFETSDPLKGGNIVIHD